MKPDIDLNSPYAKQAISAAQKLAKIALEAAEQNVEKAVIPIYHIPDGKRAEQIASGVLLKIKSEYFILSASHVFDQIGDHAILTGDGMSSGVQALIGDRFSSSRGKSGTHADDLVDASVFHIQCGISEQLKSYALSIEDFDNSSYPCSWMDPFLASGFRIKESNTANNAIHSKREAFPTSAVRENNYALLGLDPSISIALWFEEQVLMEQKWQLSPIPRGFSGGAIIRIVEFLTPQGIAYRQLLSGIITEHRKKNKDIDGTLIGTRIAVHMAILKRYMPELFE